MALRRGFKTEANNLAAEVRSELGLGMLEAFDPRRLATHLEIEIFDLTDLASDHPSICHLLDVEPDVFSAVTVFDGPRRTIVHNDAHVIGRQNSNLAHELAHGLLLHPPTPALDARGCRDWNQDIEDEAAWLSGVLLVPEPAALEIARRRVSYQDAAEVLAVSEDMIRYRVNITGATKRVARGRRAG